MNRFVEFFVDWRPMVVRIGQNPECADMDNPDGTIFGTVYVVSVSNRYGRRWELKNSIEDQDEADETVTRVQKMLDEGKKLVESEWVIGRPVYGSDCYINEGGDEEMIEWEKSLEDQ